MRGIWLNASKWGKVTIVGSAVVIVLIVIGGIAGGGNQKQYGGGTTASTPSSNRPKRTSEGPPSCEIAREALSGERELLRRQETESAEDRRYLREYKEDVNEECSAARFRHWSALQKERRQKASISGEGSDMDQPSYEYIGYVRKCQAFVGELMLDVRAQKSSMLELAEGATSARDACDNVRSVLLEIDTNHFDEEAERAWYGVDRVKSGLNALLAYIDNPEPTKLIETRDKLEEGLRETVAGVREINGRRNVYGLPPVH